jgi:hypothetical protein
VGHWRYASGTAKIGPIDLRCVFPIFLWFFSPTLIMFVLAILGILFFVGISLFGYSLPIFYRSIRHRLRGNVIDSEGWLYWRRYRK